MTHLTKEAEEAIEEEIENLEIEAKESRKRAHNSYGAGYDLGRLDGVRWVMATIKGEENDF